MWSGGSSSVGKAHARSRAYFKESLQLQRTGKNVRPANNNISWQKKVSFPKNFRPDDLFFTHLPIYPKKFSILYTNDLFLVISSISYALAFPNAAFIFKILHFSPFFSTLFHCSSSKFTTTTAQFPFCNCKLHFTTAQIVISCKIKYALVRSRLHRWSGMHGIDSWHQIDFVEMLHYVWQVTSILLVSSLFSLSVCLSLSISVSPSPSSHPCTFFCLHSFHQYSTWFQLMIQPLSNLNYSWLQKINIGRVWRPQDRLYALAADRVSGYMQIEWRGSTNFQLRLKSWWGLNAKIQTGI